MNGLRLCRVAGGFLSYFPGKGVAGLETVSPCWQIPFQAVALLYASDGRVHASALLHPPYAWRWPRENLAQLKGMERDRLISPLRPSRMAATPAQRPLTPRPRWLPLLSARLQTSYFLAVADPPLGQEAHKLQI